MSENKKSKNDKSNKKRRGLMDFFLTREKPDEDYIPDLKTQWNAMNNVQRVKFILGAVVGLTIILGGIVLIFLLISALQS